MDFTNDEKEILITSFDYCSKKYLVEEKIDKAGIEFFKQIKIKLNKWLEED
jgi:hypothetical protein